ncbi:MAG: LCP family protein [Eubacteriales bacterium]|nr:LCP family protein [Eubacteriales bacterium]
MKKIYIGVGLLFFAFILVLVLMYFNKAKVDKEIDARKEAVAVQEGADKIAETSSEDLGISLSENEVSYEGKTYLRNTYIKSYLVMGIDRKDKLEDKQVNGSGGQADAVFLVAYDTSHNSVKVLKIPRDTMTPIPMTDLSGNLLGVDYQHLTLAFGYGDGREQSCEFMCDAVSNLLADLPIDGYIAATTNVINILNDMIGGVDVVIEQDGLEKANPAFVKGETVHLVGDMAEKYVRYRDITEFNSAIDRMHRQTQYLINFEKQFKAQAVQDDELVVKMLDAITPYMITDLDKGTYLRLAMDIAASEDLTEEDFVTLPGEAVEGIDFDEYHPHEDEIVDLMLSLFFREST